MRLPQHRHQRYAAIDPLNTFGPVLDRQTPVEHCCCLCCRCSRERGIYWALGVFSFEAVWHITLSVLRPTWEWTSTAVTVFAYFLQDLLRLWLLFLCFHAWRALKKGEAAVADLRMVLRALIVLFFLEVIEVALKAFEVHAVCDAPEVWERRRRPDYHGLSEAQCELVSDLYDYGWGAMSLLVIGTVIRAVHSHVRSLGGATWSSEGQAQGQGQGQGEAQNPEPRAPTTSEVV
jgi:hypothetical protein